MTEVVAALVRDGDRFMICQRPAHKARGLLWEFVGGKVEPGETKQQALIRECREELAVTVTVGDVFMDVVHEYPDLTVHLTLFSASIAEGEPRLLEHNAIKWITAKEIPQYAFCPADEEILVRIIRDAERKEGDNSMNDNILLVDVFDDNIGYAPKAEVHERGLLHRAFSVFIVDGGKMLLQRRGRDKYHSGGLLTNACCSHQREGESLGECVKLRLREELGAQFEAKELFSFVYYTKFENGLTEYEYDHVFLGEYSGELTPDPQEIDELVWVDMDELAVDMRLSPEKYTVWFLSAAPRVIEYIRKS